MAVFKLRRTLLLAFALVPLTCSGGLGAGESRANSFPDVGSIAYKERVRKHPLASALDQEALLLPGHNVMMPGGKLKPKKIKAGAELKWFDGSGRQMDPCRIVWKRVPWRKEHAAYLKYRSDKLGAAEGPALLAWCDKKGLDECAGFETRRLVAMGSKAFGTGIYRSLLTRLHRIVGAEQPPWNFPLPFDGEWHVLRDRTGHHRFPKKQGGAAYAFDLVVQRGGRSYTGSGRQLTDHLCFDRTVRAQADGEVLKAVGQYPDTSIGQLGAMSATNFISVDYGAGVVGFYAHLRQGSVTLKPGDRVVAGQVIGRVGNSGASGIPHLHFTFVDHTGLSTPGRYRVEVQRGNRWIEVADKDLEEGTTVRNRPGALPPAKRLSGGKHK